MSDKNKQNKQKALWESLAKENSRYYINSDKGRKISEEDFTQSGKNAYEQLIAKDELIKNKDTILDFGCGTGRIMQFMANDFQKVYGVDISKTMIEKARERLAGIMNVYLAETDGIHIPLPESSIENVFSYLVFQHIKERGMVEADFAEIFRILKKGGIFKVLMRSDKAKNMNDWWSGVGYNEGAIEKVYTESGFKLIKTEHVDKFAYWLWLKKI